MIAISHHVEETLVERLGLEAEGVVVIHLGLDHDLFQPDDTEPRLPFLLYPANPWPHKNHARLFDAFARVPSARPELRLILTGTGLERLGRVPEGSTSAAAYRAELAELYRTAVGTRVPEPL